jgi:hypothetical protein
MSERGAVLERGETEGRGEALTLGAAVTLGAADGCWSVLTLGAADGLGETAGTGLGDGLGVALWIQSKIELFAKAACRFASFRTSPPLNFPRVRFAGNVAVGRSPTGIGS